MASTSDTNVYMFKVLIVGQDSTGKTALLNRYTNDTFIDTYVSTIGVDFQIKSTQLQGNNIKAQIWDTAGQERFRNITSSYYRGCHGAIIVFDVTNRSTFKQVENWITDIEHYANESIPKLLVGNKCDLTKQRCVTQEEAKSFAVINNMDYIETSAKTNMNVTDAFESLYAGTSGFGESVADTDIDALVQYQRSKNTDRNTRWAYNAFEVWRKSRPGMPVLEELDINTHLSRFVVEVRQWRFVQRKSAYICKKESQQAPSQANVARLEAVGFEAVGVTSAAGDVAIGTESVASIGTEDVPPWAKEMMKEIQKLNTRLEAVDKLENTVASMSKRLDGLENKMSKYESKKVEFKSAQAKSTKPHK